MDNRIKVKGKFKFELIKPDGTIIETIKYNSIVDTGYQYISDSLFSPGRTVVLDQIGVGSGATAVTLADTALESITGNKTVSTYSYANNVATVEATFAAGEATGSITEAGIYTNDMAILLNRVTFSVINKGVDDTLKVTFTITLS